MSALAQPQLRLTPSEYLARERLADHKSEFFDGEIFAMAGANERHNLIAANIISELSSALKKTPCKVYSSDMRVKIPATGLVHLSIVVCGEPVFEDEAKDTLLNPVLIAARSLSTTVAFRVSKNICWLPRIDARSNNFSNRNMGNGFWERPAIWMRPSSSPP